MENTTLEPILRLGAFAGVFIVLALVELIRPRRRLIADKARRWFTNLSLVVINTATLRLIFYQMLAVGFAGYAQSRGWGLFNALGWPIWLEFVLAVVLLDFTIYLQHVAMHKIGFLWALHRVHHADRDFDVTTALRFHPIEIAISMAYKFLVIALLGASALAVLAFEIILNATAMFTHANIKLPLGLDKVLRYLLVTPDMHRIHHSVHLDETDSNYGFALSLWDRLCGTYITDPVDGHEDMVIGIVTSQTDAPTRLGHSLLIPFMKGATRRPDEIPQP
jgi:sterol desaturase/sphingolipid hydroxylase (fatty acid hydroxylase superfamily)